MCTRVQDHQYPCIAIFLHAGPENMASEVRMHSQICIPLQSLIPTRLFGSWMSMGVVGWN